ncbi:hypothetical protein SAMN05443633_109174 [Chryseobacterium arachidis]|uniref:Uncharacterized protein n=1 Tax=Chryseobacterium arachidis TaxID=1416778 RepID=A0A1M5GM19_9FLAO|nr:hypothetical protein SAMN05443633_109174 [Chryseobacterium arachidis]
MSIQKYGVKRLNGLAFCDEFYGFSRMTLEINLVYALSFGESSLNCRFILKWAKVYFY